MNNKIAVLLVLIILCFSGECLGKTKIDKNPEEFIFKMVGSSKYGKTTQIIGKNDSGYFAKIISIDRIYKKNTTRKYLMDRNSFTRFVNMLNYIDFLNLKPLYEKSYGYNLIVVLLYKSQGKNYEGASGSDNSSYYAFYPESLEKRLLQNHRIKNHNEFLELRDTAFRWSYLILYISSIFEFRDKDGKLSYWK